MPGRSLSPPPLESGDRLTRAEFHSRYCARPDIKRAELIGGVVYVASPVGDLHSKQQSWAITWMGVYAARTPGVELRDNGTIYLSSDSEVQPDACLFRSPPTGANGARVTDDGYIEGTPDLVFEVAASSASYDLHDKKEIYRRAGVPEYVVWRVLDKQIDWFRLRDGDYVRIEPDENGVIESVTFPGLRLAVDKMLAGDMVAVLAALNTPDAA